MSMGLVIALMWQEVVLLIAGFFEVSIQWTTADRWQNVMLFPEPASPRLVASI